MDFFRSFLADPYVFGQVAAHHALSDIYAMGAQPQSAMAVAVVPHGPDAKVEQELLQLMSGAVQALQSSGCLLVGGHTVEGSELSLGFSVTGVVPEGAVLRKTGALPGQALILTKPLGTGA